MKFKHKDGFIMYKDGKVWKRYSSYQVTPEIFTRFLRDKKTKPDKSKNETNPT